METHQEFRDELVVEHDNGISMLITVSSKTDRQKDRQAETGAWHVCSPLVLVWLTCCE